MAWNIFGSAYNSNMNRAELEGEITAVFHKTVIW